MPYGTFTTPVNAPVDRIWETLLDKARHPHRYIPYEVLDYKIHNEFENGIVREIKTAEMHMTERVTFDKASGTVTFTLVDHPIYEGTLINRVSPPRAESGGLPTVTYTMDVKPRSESAEQLPEANWFKNAVKPEMISKAVLHLKSMVEGESKGAKTMTTAKPEGANSQLVRRMFEAGESMNVNNFVKFYADNSLYQFSNFPVAHGPQGIIDSSQGFLQKVKKVVHNIENIWEIDNETVVVEMTVRYDRHDGKTFTLPCCDTIRIRNGKVQSLKIFMDITPVFAD